MLGSTHCARHWAPASAPRAAGIHPASGASALITIKPVLVGEATINRSALVTSSFSGVSARCAAVERFRTGSFAFTVTVRSLQCASGALWQCTAFGSIDHRSVP